MVIIVIDIIIDINYKTSHTFWKSLEKGWKCWEQVKVIDERWINY